MANMAGDMGRPKIPARNACQAVQSPFANQSPRYCGEVITSRMLGCSVTDCATGPSRTRPHFANSTRRRCRSAPDWRAMIAPRGSVDGWLCIWQILYPHSELPRQLGSGFLDRPLNLFLRGDP